MKHVISCLISGNSYEVKIINQITDKPKKAIYKDTIYNHGYSYNIYWSVGTINYFAYQNK